MILDVPKAGGIATTGSKRILDIVPKSIHERAGIYLGSKDDVLDVIKFYIKSSRSSIIIRGTVLEWEVGSL